MIVHPMQADQVKERPILFSPDLKWVRAAAGRLKVPPEEYAAALNDGMKHCGGCGVKKPRTSEFFGLESKSFDKLRSRCKDCVTRTKKAHYARTRPQQRARQMEYAATPRNDEPAYKWRPSIHMPRWASRILLEITEVRVQRLRSITEADALAEGIVRLPDGGFGLPKGEHYHAADPRISYLSLWESINGPGSVEADPWVFAISFRRIHAS